jgi:hypothetical protein
MLVKTGLLGCVRPTAEWLILVGSDMRRGEAAAADLTRECIPEESPMLTHETPSTDLQRPYVLLPSGNIIDLADPDPDSWTDEDLALGLSRTYRWGGHSRWPRPLTVAQHSLSVLAIRRQRNTLLSPQLSLYELLHDAEEGLIGFDCVAPLKAFLGARFAELSARLMSAIATRYRLPKLTAEEHRLHKLADRQAAASEALHVTSWSAEQIEITLQIRERPLERDPLGAAAFLDGWMDWEPWSPDYARRQWLDALRAESEARTALGAGR